MKKFNNLAASTPPERRPSEDVQIPGMENHHIPPCCEQSSPSQERQQESPPICKHGINVLARRWIICADVGALQSSLHVKVNRSTAHSSKSSFNSHH